MVVTEQHLATEVGVDVLKKGGNAVDAAVAVGYALAVVFPEAGNIGGEGFMTIRLKDGRTTFIDFRERAPLAAARTMYLDKDGKPIKGASLDGYLAVGVPGSVAGFEMACEKYGTLSRQDLMALAIAYARAGFVLNQGDAAWFADSADRLAKDPAAAAIFLKKTASLMASARSSFSRTSPPRCRRSRKRGRTPSKRAPSPTPSSRRAAPGAASSPRAISSNMRCAN